MLTVDLFLVMPSVPPFPRSLFHLFKPVQAGTTSVRRARRRDESGNMACNALGGQVIGRLRKQGCPQCVGPVQLG